MGLSSIIRSAVATVDQVTADLQVTVRHARRTGLNDYATPTYASAVSRQALVELGKHRDVTDAAGKIHAVKALITFPRPVVIGLDDQVTLPDGGIYRVVHIEGYLDPLTDDGYTKEVWVA